jgi:hypothetical protein
MKRILNLIPVGAVALAIACEDRQQPLAPENVQFTWSSAAETDEYAADPTPVHGAIFTTLPDGSAVNANTQYTQKIEVYLDGGPRNPNSLAGETGLAHSGARSSGRWHWQRRSQHADGSNLDSV